MWSDIAIYRYFVAIAAFPYPSLLTGTLTKTMNSGFTLLLIKLAMLPHVGGTSANAGCGKVFLM
jgi:hypothetical protein